MSAVNKIPVDVAEAVLKPVLIRAGVALIFGLTTVFVQSPGHWWMKIALALFLVFSGSAMWEYLRRDVVPEAMRSPLSMAAAAWMLGTIVMLFLGSTSAVAIAVGVALTLGGIAELVAWAQHRQSFAPARDQLITGAVGVGSGIGVLLLGPAWLGGGLDPHGVLGVVGGGAIIIGVMLLVSGIGMWLDVRKAGGTVR